MGCFSFLCKKTGEPILSSSFSGDAVHLFLLKNGKVIEYMFGNYDSYGRVFDKNDDSFEWKMEWGDVVDLMFDENKKNGIAAILDIAYTKGEIPTERSQDDPNQGWGKHGQLLGYTGKDIGKKVKNPIHEVYDENPELL